MFRIDRQRFAVRLAQVQRVVPAAAVTPAPGAPSVMLGVIDLQGEVVPVLDRRGAAAHPLRLADQFIVVREAPRTMVLRVDEVEGVVERDDAQCSPIADRDAGLAAYEGSTRLDDDLVLVHDLARFLSPSQQREVDRALEAAR